MEWNEDGTVGRCHIARLPNEILLHVLQYVSTRQLLRCRDVSSRWNQLASSACRQRQVQILVGPCRCGFKINHLRPKDQLCLPRPSDVNFAPWSAIDLVFPLVTCQDKKPLVDIPEHLGTTLSLMTKFTATLNGAHGDALFFRVLEYMPSLQVLCIKTPDDCGPHSEFKPPADMVLDLSTLREVDTEFTTQTACQVLEFILTRTVTSVRRVTLRQSPWVDEWDILEPGAVFSRIWPLLKGIDTVTLIVTYFGPKSFDWSTLVAEPRPNLKRLVISSRQNFDLAETDHFKMLEQFLGKCCQHLESLSLIGFNAIDAQYRDRGRGLASVDMLEVPMLPALRHLHIYVQGMLPRRGSPYYDTFRLRHFSAFTALQFPELRSVHLQCDSLANGEFDAFGINDTFSTVRFLTVEGFYDTRLNQGAWNRFPTIKGMTLKVKEGRQLAAVFSRSIAVDELKIDLEPEVEEGVDSILYEGFRNVSPNMDIKKLVVKTPADLGLRDRSAILFNLLKPLHLVLCNARNLSENCLSELRNHHHAVQLDSS